jgi:hypothetical protein
VALEVLTHPPIIAAHPKYQKNASIGRLKDSSRRIEDTLKPAKRSPYSDLSLNGLITVANNFIGRQPSRRRGD